MYGKEGEGDRACTGKMEEGTMEGKRNISIVLFNIYLKALIYLI